MPDQYKAIPWTIEDGLPNNGNNVMIKDANGFLWVGSSYGGLTRFDGAIFKKYILDPHKLGGLINNEVLSFTEDSLHNLWIGTKSGMARYDILADTFSYFPISLTRSNNREAYSFWATKNEVYCFESDFQVVAYNIHSFKKRNVCSLNASDKIKKWYTILDTTANSLWLLEYGNPLGGGLVQIGIKNGERRYYTWPCSKKKLPHRHNAEAMQLDPRKSSVWINSGDGLVEFSLMKKQFFHVDAFNHILREKDYDRNVGIGIDKWGRVWFSSFRHGVFIYTPDSNKIKPLFSNPAEQKKIGEANLHIYCDKDGIQWTSYWTDYAGLYEIIPYNPPVKRYLANSRKKDSLSSGDISTIVQGPQGKLWIGTGDGLNIFDPRSETFEVLRQTDLPGIAGKAIFPLYVDTIQRRAWLSAGYSEMEKYFSMKMYEMNLDTRACTPVLFQNIGKKIENYSTVYGTVAPYKDGILFCDQLHGVFAVKKGLSFADLVVPLVPGEGGFGYLTPVENHHLFIQGGGFLPNYSFENKDDKWIRAPHFLDSLMWWSMLYNEKEKTIWVSFQNELVLYDKDFKIIKRFDQNDGYNSFFLQMQFDHSGNIWFVNYLKQLGRLNPQTNSITIFSQADGYQKQDYGWYVPLTGDANGNLYSGVGWQDATASAPRGLDRIYPERYTSPATSAVYVRSLFINHRAYSFGTAANNLEHLSLSHDESTITIETGIVDFYAKGKGHVRYKLQKEGKVETWQLGSAYTTIRYETLAPGTYELILQASNTADEFNSPEKTLLITIRPPFWETWWFRMLTVISILLLFYFIYRMRTTSLQKQKAKLERTVEQRTAEVVRQKEVIEKEKERSDELLLNILPSTVADELKEKGYTTAKAFDEVTVLFSDVKGFTHVAEKLTPQALVKEIDIYFSAFDKIMMKYGLEKIKTIGDAYVAAGGLPENNTADAADVVKAAVAMQEVVEELKQERTAWGRPHFELRIGIHTGTVVAGVVGIKKFQYDIWGDTVNLSARMEQSGVPGKINISQQTYELVKRSFICIHRGKIEAKNKGDIDMYFVEAPIV